MIIKGYIGKQEIDLGDVEVFLTREQAENMLWHLQSFKEQEENAPLTENEAFINGEIIDNVILKNSIEIFHRK